MYRMSERVYSKSKMMEIRRAKIKGRGRDKGRVILRLRVVERGKGKKGERNVGGNVTIKYKIDQKKKS